MSERPTDTQPSHAAAAHGSGRDERARYAVAGAQSGAGQQSLANRAANFRQGAPFLVERATLYDPEPPDQPKPVDLDADLPPRRLLPAALTLLGVVVVVGLSAGILFVRNADVIRTDEATGRLEQFSDRGLKSERPQGPAGIAYDLTRRPTDTIVGAWRPGRAGGRETSEAGPVVVSEAPPATRTRRPLPRRLSAPPAPRAPDVAPEPVTRSVIVSPAPRYDAPEPKRRHADGERPNEGPAGAPRETVTAARPARGPPEATEQASAESRERLGERTGERLGERHGPSVVARVGRASEPSEAEGPAVEIPLDALALPLRRPDAAALAEAGEDNRSAAAHARRARILRLQRRHRREERHARKRAFDERSWAPEALYGNRFTTLEGLLP
jgi:hypothetical protein